jgi:transcriptional regulator with XRE-family HTH domain
MSATLREENSNESNPLDMHMGNRLRMRRTVMGFSQEKLAKMVGLTFQQVQKYESAANRISASRLYDIAAALNVSVTYFYQDIPGTPSTFAGMAEQGQEAIEGTEAFNLAMADRETYELVRAYHRIDDPKKRRRVLDLIRVMSDEA